MNLMDGGELTTVLQVSQCDNVLMHKVKFTMYTGLQDQRQKMERHLSGVNGMLAQL